VLPDESQPSGDRSPIPTRKGAKPKTGLRYIFVNGRTPRSQAHCASCRAPVDDSYMRDIATGAVFCNRRCSKKHSRRMSELALQLRAWVVS